MSVFIRKDNKKGVYSYEFIRGGHRFSGSTKETRKDRAEKREREIIDEVEAELKANGGVLASEMTLEAACARWMAEKGNNRTDRIRCLKNFAWLLGHFGYSTMLHDIDENRISAMIAVRQSHSDRRFKNEAPRRIGPATVNRTAIDPIQHVIVRARDTWKVRVAPVRWSKLRLKEPQERVREATTAEERALLAHMSRGYDKAIEFLFQTGLRRKELIGLRWTDVDWFNRRIVVLGKGDKKRFVPLSKKALAILREIKDQHPEFVFTFGARLTRKTGEARQIRGERYPLTHEGFASAMERAVKKANLSDFHMHDIRHTTASRVVRGSNLKVAQRLLGHSDIRTTMRYVHAHDDDVRDALDSAIPTENPTNSAQENASIGNDNDISNLRN